MENMAAKALKAHAMNDPSDLYEFEALANLMEALPRCFDKTDFEAIGIGHH